MLPQRSTKCTKEFEETRFLSVLCFFVAPGPRLDTHGPDLYTLPLASEGRVRPARWEKVNA